MPRSCASTPPPKHCRTRTFKRRSLCVLSEILCLFPAFASDSLSNLALRQPSFDSQTNPPAPLEPRPHQRIGGACDPDDEEFGQHLTSLNAASLSFCSPLHQTLRPPRQNIMKEFPRKLLSLRDKNGTHRRSRSNPPVPGIKVGTSILPRRDAASDRFAHSSEISLEQIG